jgi:hypothetical protein
MIETIFEQFFISYLLNKTYLLKKMNIYSLSALKILACFIYFRNKCINLNFFTYD